MILETLFKGVVPNLSVLAQVAEGATDVPADFRPHVWLAYGLVLALLAAFTIFVLVKLGKTENRIAHLSERFDKVHPEEKKT